MVRIITALIATGSLLGAAVLGSAGSHVDLPTDDPAVLQQLQEDFLVAQGTDVAELAVAVRAHLGLPATRLGEASEDCDLALGEADPTDASSHHVADPELVLEALLAEIETAGPTDLAATLDFLRRSGGRVVWDPEAVDATGWIAIQTTRNLRVGTRWIEAATIDPEAVHANLQHEVGGHLFYGHTLACRIVETALVEGDPVDRWQLFRDLAYPESEIYAELKELPHVRDSSLGDEPVEDITRQVAAIRAGFPADVAELLLASMGHRFANDATLSPEALALFRSIVV